MRRDSFYGSLISRIYLQRSSRGKNGVASNFAQWTGQIYNLGALHALATQSHHDWNNLCFIYPRYLFAIPTWQGQIENVHLLDYENKTRHNRKI